jgi:NADH:ubiquinone oxidoreductase subunit E
MSDKILDDITENLWNKIVDTGIIGDQCGDDLKKIIISLCSSDSDSHSTQRSIDFNQILHMGYETRRDCFLVACMFNNDLRLIDRLIDDFKINSSHKNRNGDNCLTLGCRYNGNLEIIKYMIQDLSMDPNYTNNDGDNCLMLACQCNANLEIIKYLINDLQMDINQTNHEGDNCLTLACYDNTNMGVIKYLINDLSMDPRHTDNNGYNCLVTACWNNPNLEIIKYLIQDLKMDINHKVDDGGDCFSLACWENMNLEIVKYLIESTHAEIRFGYYVYWDRYQRWKEIIKLVSKNFNRFRDMLIVGVVKFKLHYDDLNDFLKTLNPLLLIGKIPCISSLDIMDPMDQKFKFNDYVKCVDDLQSFIIPTSIYVPAASIQKGDDEIDLIPLIDFSSNLSLLFEYNGSEYHGHREIVYDSILCLKEIKDVAVFDQLITLSGSVPKYIINMWIWSMYSRRFNLMDVKPCDLILFLDHIDQYPTDFLTICTIEDDLIKYMDTDSQDIVFEDLIPCLKTISLRCRLKRLYLWIHNKEILIRDKLIND